MTKVRRYVVEFVAMSFVLGCGDKKPAAERAGSEFFGASVTLPGLLAKVHAGMTFDELRAVAPDAVDDDGHGWLLATPASNIKLYALLDSETHRVAYSYVDYEGSDGGRRARPRRLVNHSVWRNAKTGWRATVFCGHGTDDDAAAAVLHDRLLSPQTARGDVHARRSDRRTSSARRAGE